MPQYPLLVLSALYTGLALTGMMNIGRCGFFRWWDRLFFCVSSWATFYAHTRHKISSLLKGTPRFRYESVPHSVYAPHLVLPAKAVLRQWPVSPHQEA